MFGTSDLELFRDEYLANAEAVPYHAKWIKANPGENALWLPFRDAVLSGADPTPPSMRTKYGRALVGAGRIQMALRSRIIGVAKPPILYPASFHAGPLGGNTPVAADPNGVVVVMWSFYTGNSASQQRDMHLQRMTDCGRSWDGIQSQLDGLTDGGVTTEEWINSEGILPCITWSPGGSIYDIAAGSSDAAIHAVADRFASRSFPIMLRLFHEFEGYWNPYYHENDAAGFINAWEHVVERFQARGADNVGFWWCPGELGGNPERAMVNSCYPGDTLVDWTGADHYNRDRSDVWSTPLHNGWADFDEISNYDKLGWTTNLSMSSQWGGRKLFVTGETSCLFEQGDATRKADWFREIDTVCKPHSPNLRGIAFFDAMTIPNETTDWRVDSDQSTEEAESSHIGTAHAGTYQGFKDLVATPRWNVGWA